MRRTGNATRRRSWNCTAHWGLTISRSIRSKPRRRRPKRACIAFSIAYSRNRGGAWLRPGRHGGSPARILRRSACRPDLRREPLHRFSSLLATPDAAQLVDAGTVRRSVAFADRTAQQHAQRATLSRRSAGSIALSAGLPVCDRHVRQSARLVRGFQLARGLRGQGLEASDGLETRARPSLRRAHAADWQPTGWRELDRLRLDRRRPPRWLSSALSRVEPKSPVAGRFVAVCSGRV